MFDTRDAVQTGRKAKLLYIVTTGGNPMGSCTTHQRVAEIYALASKYEVSYRKPVMILIRQTEGISVRK